MGQRSPHTPRAFVYPCCETNMYNNYVSCLLLCYTINPLQSSRHYTLDPPPRSCMQTPPYNLRLHPKTPPTPLSPNHVFVLFAKTKLAPYNVFKYLSLLCGDHSTSFLQVVVLSLASKSPLPHSSLAPQPSLCLLLPVEDHPQLTLGQEMVKSSLTVPHTHSCQPSRAALDSPGI